MRDIVEKIMKKKKREKKGRWWGEEEIVLKEKEREVTLQKMAHFWANYIQNYAGVWGNIGTIGSTISCCNNWKYIYAYKGGIRNDKN